MATARRHSQLMPWYIGLAIIVLVDIYIAFQFFATNCAAPQLAQFLVVIAVPAVYLVLMYLTLRSQP